MARSPFYIALCTVQKGCDKTPPVYRHSSGTAVAQNGQIGVSNGEYKLCSLTLSVSRFISLACGKAWLDCFGKKDRRWCFISACRGPNKNFGKPFRASKWSAVHRVVEKSTAHGTVFPLAISIINLPKKHVKPSPGITLSVGDIHSYKTFARMA